MIPARELLSHLKKMPFTPFRIILNSGKTIDVPHPEMVRVGKVTFVVFEPDAQDTEYYDIYSTVSLFLVARIEHREPATIS